MTKEQAHELLDSVKDGNAYPSIKRITEALWVTGDAPRPLPKHTRPFSEDGINEWMESTRMVPCEGTGKPLPWHFSGNKSGIDADNEGKK